MEFIRFTQGLWIITFANLCPKFGFSGSMKKRKTNKRGKYNNPKLQSSLKD
jgi:hypothetical protein